MATRLRGRPAHAPGPTFLAYTPNGRKLVTAGLNGALRIFQHGSDDEPAVIDVTTDAHTAIVASDDFLIVGAEDGSVAKYSLTTNTFEEYLTRCSLPVRDIALSRDGQWAAVASDELEVKVVNTRDMTKVIYLREQQRPVKNVSFDVNDSTIAVSCTDGVVYMYSISSEQPQLLKRCDGLIQSLEADAEASARVYWHPDGRAFAVPSSTRDFQIVARSDWQKQQKVFADGHRGDISAAAWSHNGAVLVTAGMDKTLVLWDTRTQKMIKSFDDVQHPILAIDWHPVDNVLSYTNTNGELFIRNDFIPGEWAKLLKITLQAAPLNGDPLSEISGNARKALPNGQKHTTEDDYLDDLLGPDAMSEDDDGFIDDDDGAGYAEETNRHLKRSGEALSGPPAKRPAPYSSWRPEIHDSFQPGSTPWKGSRRYLCLNLTGFVWTVNQETHHTVTVEFYDRQEHRDFHFTDPYMYDKACLNEKGAVFSCKQSTQHGAMLYYRPHETWTARTDWRTALPPGEEVTSMSLSETCIVVTTTTGYVRIYSLFGVPLKVYRQKSTPAVTCASFRDYVMTIGNGPVGADGITRLLYTIENVKRDETCQSEDILPLPEGVSLRSVFFSDKGDPCVYDTDGVLLVLLHWRTPGQAKWMPLLDTKTLARLASGKKEESYWPVAVADDRFHCIILKGGEEYPYFPRPLLSDFEFRIPTSNPPTEEELEEDKDASEQKNLEERFTRSSLMQGLMQDMLEHTNSSFAQRRDLAQTEAEMNRVLLQLLNLECAMGEERGMKALEIVGLLRGADERVWVGAGKIAGRYGLEVLAGKIAELAEERLREGDKGMMEG